MEATRPVSSGTVQREKPTGSADSLVTPTSVPTGSPVSPESVSLGQVAEPPGRNLWEQICEEYEAELPHFPEGYIIKQEAPVTISLLEELVSHDFDTEYYLPDSHSTTISNTPCPQTKSETVNPKTCSPREYLETFIFPVLLPGMAGLLHQAKQEKCFEPTATNPTLPPIDRRGSSNYHTILLERLSAPGNLHPALCLPEGDLIEMQNGGPGGAWSQDHITLATLGIFCQQGTNYPVCMRKLCTLCFLYHFFNEKT
ncbi:IQ domain-containing protein K isoform X6 [Heterocephalus glaber]|uniref:IQ domain-containing protein K isoform X6 n=1 Tax=Heterocephalus glaber TaxID=10181 RepID=A0AAX6R7R2_HETGA|nr:IQ domain-containing protein K isoform X6 [Heterocephalus glaber]